MHRGDRLNKQAKQAILIACCLVFVFFSYVYLTYFQSDVLTMTQHVMSGGRTTYRVILFSSIITLLLAILPFALTKYLKFPIRFLAVAWFPSFLILGWLTDVGLSEVNPESHGIGILPFVIAIILFGLASYMLPKFAENTIHKSSLVSSLWPNLLVFVVCMAFTTYVGNTNRTIHFELRLERLISQEKYDEVIELTSKEDYPSRCVMSIRAYALSKQNRLADNLFFYPNRVGGETLLPPPTDSLRPANIPAVLKDYLGGYPIHDMSATHFFQYLAADTVYNECVKDYLLCAFLLDKNLDNFVDSLIVYYGPKDEPQSETDKSKKNVKKKTKEVDPVKFSNLPRHYAEALLLYSRLHENPKALLEDDETLENFEGFQSTYKKESDPKLREQLCRTYYNETYWVFYHFTK